MATDSHDAQTTFDKERIRSSHTVRALAVAALLALPIGLLSACGGDDEPETIAIDAVIEIATERDSTATSTTIDQDVPALTPASEQVRPRQHRRRRAGPAAGHSLRPHRQSARTVAAQPAPLLAR